MARTTYVILRKYQADTSTGRPELWQALGETDGDTDIAAIKKLATDEPGETYVAVPKRSFRERTGSVETQMRFKLT